MAFSERLRQLRENKKISRDDLASHLGLSYWAISKYETGERTPDHTTLERIADYFGVSVDYLLGRNDNSRINRKLKLPPDIRKIARAGERMTPEQREKWLDIARVLFPEAFKDEENEKDT
ncbi:helix-turn-helix domain-containing protein [Desulfurispora thermophila]|uniref:helix-turn-helix domain-containing protein n=1 Tax=Desulfurispora thermophila TaxID=265470 RepID=UPI00036FB898|nr:helix-turn-helix transcriptional regulator [Desulfurispora thermophila]